MNIKQIRLDLLFCDFVNSKKITNMDHNEFHVKPTPQPTISPAQSPSIQPSPVYLEDIHSS